MLRWLVVAVILFCGIFTSFIIVSNDVFSNYGVTPPAMLEGMYAAVNDSIMSSYDIGSNISEKMGTPQGITSDSPTSINTGVSLFSAINYAWQTMTFMPTLVTNIFLVFMPENGLLWAGIFGSIIGIIIIFWVISAIRGTEV